MLIDNILSKFSSESKTMAETVRELDNSEEQESFEQSRKTRIVKRLVSEFNHNEYIKANFVGNKRSVSDFDKPFRYPDHFETEQIHLENFSMELLTWKESKSPWVILQLHGGGYMNAFKSHYRSMAGLYSEVSRGGRVLSIDYRVAPENPYPAALEDAMAAYEWLLEQGYQEKNIVFAGDSAGGGLALSMCHYLKDHGRKLPAGFVLMSPWTDVTTSGASYKEKYDIDPVFGNMDDSLIFNNPYPGDEDPANPYISPLFGEFEGFPPMLIQVGTDEMLYDDSKALAEKAKLADIRVRYTEYEGMFHVFQAAGTMIEESKRAWAEVGKFFEALEENSRELTVGLAEINIVWEDKEANLKKVRASLDKFAGQGGLLLFPEMSLTGFSMNTDATKDSILDGEDQTYYTVSVMKELAKEYQTAIGFGWVSKDGENLAKNHYTIVTPRDGVLTDYVKLHPFSYGGECDFFEGGDTLSVGRYHGMSIGQTICYDLRFPEIYQILSKKADLIVVPANWPERRSEHWKSLLVARAIENQCYIAGINCVGMVGDQYYSGDSVLLSPAGNKLPEREVIYLDEEMKTADADKILVYDIENIVEQTRTLFPVKKDRREALYVSYMNGEQEL